MKDRAYAKINLSLDIVRRREDGYHEINSIMIPVDFFDEVEIEKNNEMEYRCNEPMIFDEKNTLVKAVCLMKGKYAIKDNFKLTLNKKIPSQAGLGGGSADGASVIRILNKMYQLNMSYEEMDEIALKIGADTVFTLHNKTAVVSGIGEKLSYFNLPKNSYVLLVKPNEGVSTVEAYKSLNLESCAHPDIEAIRNALLNKEEVGSMIANSLEEPALRLCPAIQKVKDELKALGFEYPLMSGSGSTVFVLSDKKEDLILAKDKLEKEYPFVLITKFLTDEK